MSDIESLTSKIIPSIQVIKRTPNEYAVRFKEFGARQRPNCLSTWFPKIQEAGLPVPKTIIFDFPGCLTAGCDGNKDRPDVWFEAVQAIKSACDEMGYPCFLRSGQTSNKHDWKHSCYIESADVDIASHIANIAYVSAMFDLAADVWVVREFLKTKPIFTAFDDMPVTREFRFFADEEKVYSAQAYWDSAAFKDRSSRPSVEDWQPLVDQLNTAEEDEMRYLAEMSIEAAKAVGGQWSVDWLLTTDRGWVLTDMALASLSYVWDDTKTMLCLSNSGII